MWKMNYYLKSLSSVINLVLNLYVKIFLVLKYFLTYKMFAQIVQRIHSHPSLASPNMNVLYNNREMIKM